MVVEGGGSRAGRLGLAFLPQFCMVVPLPFFHYHFGGWPTKAGHPVARLVCEFVFGLAALSAKDKGDLFCGGFYWNEATDGNFSLSFLSFGFYCFTSVFVCFFFSFLLSFFIFTLFSLFSDNFSRNGLTSLCIFLFVYPVLPFVVLLAESGVNVFSSNFCWRGWLVATWTG